LAAEKIHIEAFLELANSVPVLDVRSPAEYLQAHIPGALSFPLFSDEERKLVGTTYKQQSREAAIKIALDFFGLKMRKMVEEAESIVGNWPLSKTNRQISDTSEVQCRTDKRILVHCWRGGMRSAAIAWLLDLYGFKVYTLIGGYKIYRQVVLESFKEPYCFRILGGYTGSGKTQVLKQLELAGELVIDLEAIACHKGSAFGAIGQPVQPSQEMFENLLSHEFRKKKTLTASDGSPVSIWLEDESQRIGLINIQQTIWERMRQSPVFFMDIPFEQRLNYVVESYGILDKEKMLQAIARIQKRLGGLETKKALHFLIEGDVRECFRILLKYYDRYYLKALHNRQNAAALVRTISCDSLSPIANAQKIISSYKSQHASKVLTNE
jgi:tRNA 2-selenouridine synthase